MPDLSDLRAGRAAARLKGDYNEAMTAFLEVVDEHFEKKIPLPPSVAADYIARIRAADRKVIAVERQPITFTEELV